MKDLKHTIIRTINEEFELTDKDHAHEIASHIICEIQKWLDARDPDAHKQPEPQEPALRSVDNVHSDPIEQIAFELAFELEEAQLSPNDLVTVNREKLRAIAKRIHARAMEAEAAPPPDTGGVLRSIENQALRAMFAGAAMQGLLANPQWSNMSQTWFTSWSVCYADKLLLELGVERERSQPHVHG